MAIKLRQFYKYLQQKSYLYQVITFYLLTFLVIELAQPLLLLVDRVVGHNTTGPDEKYLFVAIILGPILETFVFQYVIFKILSLIKLERNWNLLFLIISASLFGLSHCYSLVYVLYATITGVVLAFIYYFYRLHTKKAFWTTALIHALVNLTIAIFIKP